MYKLIFRLLAGIGIVSAPTVAAQVSLPQVNLGATSFLDGVGGPGILIQETPSYYFADTFADQEGHALPLDGEVESISTTTLIARLTDRKVLGGYYGYEALIPLARVEAFGGRGSGLGDIGISPFMIQWTDSRLFGRPYKHRLNLFFNLPTGTYSADRSVNIGSNAASFNPYYAATLELSEDWAVSTRIHYLWNDENESPSLLQEAESTQAGQAFHMNLSTSYKISEHFRLGVAGYALKQLSEHKLNGRDIAGSKEQVFAIGPGLGYYNGKFTINFNSYFESGAENRSEGARYHLRIAKVL
ncbi:SphA family protein [Marinimicrobium locisalis]|uniref:SphA family protein n=1 Tax=Marinimicrobium locisalis TaxID=546022 RepID=UPI003221E0D5